MEGRQIRVCLHNHQLSGDAQAMRCLRRFVSVFVPQPEIRQGALTSQWCGPGSEFRFAHGTWAFVVVALDQCFVWACWCWRWLRCWCWTAFAWGVQVLALVLDQLFVQGRCWVWCRCWCWRWICAFWGHAGAGLCVGAAGAGAGTGTASAFSWDVLAQVLCLGALPLHRFPAL